MNIAKKKKKNLKGLQKRKNYVALLHYLQLLTELKCLVSHFSKVLRKINLNLQLLRSTLVSPHQMFYVVQSPCWSGSLALAHVHYSLDRVDDELPWVGNQEQLITVTNSIFSFSTMLLSQR